MQLTALIIFVITYIGIIFTRLPKINVDRPSAAFFGAVAMVVFGVLNLEEAVRAIDYNTIALLLGMMVIISVLQLDGFFSLIAEKTLSWSKTPLKLLIIITFVTGIASAFLVNDAVVLLFTPVIIAICRASSLNPVPYLIAEILSANIGSAMTITGNPQNMLIGISSGIDYATFFYKLLPVSLLGMALIVVMVRWFYPSHFGSETVMVPNDHKFEYRFDSMKFSVPVFLGVVVMFFLGKLLHLSIPVIALTGASFILIFGKVKPSLVIRNVDWVLLLFFASLFIVVEGAVKTGLLDFFIHSEVLTGDIGGVVKLHGLSLFLSQIVSNVPYTVMMLPVLKPMSSEILWLSLASASTLAGNATIIGAMANLIVIESAEKERVRIGFWEFFKIGIAVTLISFAISVGVLWLLL
ncbi:MAG: SLC13 family permease [Prolixibacteraceae bacterium]|nr:SLC13 family permease [Prolixibacteraceae bacterium]